jgi:hypothetical protein
LTRLSLLDAIFSIDAKVAIDEFQRRGHKVRRGK